MTTPLLELLWLFGFAFGIAAATGGYIYQYNYRSSREVIGRKLAKLPRSSIAELREDQLVRIVGTVVQLEHVITAPISGESCVHYQVIVERRGFGRWIPIIDQSRGVPFLLDDGTGRVYVEAGRAMLTTCHLRFLPALGPDPRLDQFLRANQVPPMHKHALRIREMRIDPGATFAILGAGVADVDPDADAREGYRADRVTRLSFVGGKKHPLVISDDPALR